MLDLATRKTKKARTEHAAATKELPFQRGDVLFHSVHGLCVIKGIVGKPSGLEGLSYWIEPVHPGKHLSRYFVGVHQAIQSGFHRPISKKEIKSIFESFRCGKTAPENSSREDYSFRLRTVAQGNTAQAFAEVLLMAVSKQLYCDRGESKIVKHAAEALAQEIAVVSKITVQKAFLLIKKHLRSHLAVHPWLGDILTCKD
jgi:RNA polymerase-interacting CarD/CdnL/TRCF family regulator